MIDAAKQESKQAIGVDADQGYLGEQVMTSALKKVDVAVFEAIKGVQDDAFKGGQSTVFDVKSGGVGIGELNAEGQKYADAGAGDPGPDRQRRADRHPRGSRRSSKWPTRPR